MLNLKILLNNISFISYIFRPAYIFSSSMPFRHLEENASAKLQVILPLANIITSRALPGEFPGLARELPGK